ncbi:MAG: hypothetical protein JWM95_3087 [Gemmatimonadetes bacterium]|nr:hypothetical protein [Gemmatimonadota bacterium]
MACRYGAVPLTEYQHQLLADLAAARTDERYLAGGAALHIAPNSTRYSNDLDFFHDSVTRVASTFAADIKLLESGGYTVAVELSQPGFVRAKVTRDAHSTRVDWAHDSAWRFIPLVRDTLGGLLLHPVDLAVNKVLALAGRDEPRDFVDILFINDRILSLGALCWAAVGKDLGFTPLSLLELLKRRGRYRPEDFARLDLAVPFELIAAKSTWLAALDDAEVFVRSRPPAEIGCLYWSSTKKAFGAPTPADLSRGDVRVHWGAPGGVLPRLADFGLAEP